MGKALLLTLLIVVLIGANLGLYFFVVGLETGPVKSVTTTKPSLCKEASNLSDRDDCYERVALETGNGSYCNKTSSVDRETFCKFNLALKMKDVSLCPMNSWELDDICVYFVIVYAQNPGECRKINNTRLLTNCVAISSRDMRSCASVRDSNGKDECYYAIALLNKDYLICEKVSDFEMRTVCSAILMADERICTDLPADYKFAERFPAICLALVARDTFACSKISGVGEFCWITTAYLDISEGKSPSFQT